MRDAYAPLVWQCRYGGIEVPDQLWTYTEFGRNKPYSQNQAEHMAADPDDPLGAIDAFAERVVAHVAAKGKVEPGRHRAYGYEPPGHTLADVRLGWRDARMRVGHPRPSRPRASTTT